MTLSTKQIANAIRTLHHRIWWKPGSLERHIRTRKKRGHLPEDATVSDYEQLIRATISKDDSDVYLFVFDDTPYITVVESEKSRPWLVMFDQRGLMETAFIVENPESYLSKPEFNKVGIIKEFQPDDQQK